MFTENKMKRGQIQQIFVWISVSIVAVLIIFYGVRLINKSSELKDKALVVKFFGDFQKKIDQYYFLDKGSSGKESFLLPNNLKYMCLIKIQNNFESYSFVENKDKNLMNELFSYSNVFVGPLELYEENRAKLEHVSIGDSKARCFQVEYGQLNLRFKNNGVTDGVEITAG